MTTKTCKSCAKTLNIEKYFYVYGGVAKSFCKICEIERVAKYQKRVNYYQKRKKIYPDYFREYYSKNKEKFATYHRKFKERNPDYFKNYMRLRRA